MSATASALVQKVWNYAHVLKDDGLAFMDYTEQITFLLFLKMAHERELLGRVVELRNRCVANNGSPGNQAQDENQLVEALKHLLVVVENYPQLKADQHFLKLQHELVNTENRIQAARRFYNGNVRDYRNKCESFPSNVIAGMFGFQPHEFFTVSPSVQEMPDVEFPAVSSQG